MIFFGGQNLRMLVNYNCLSLLSQIHTLPLFFQLNTGFLKIHFGAKVIGQIYWMVHSTVLKNRENRKEIFRENIGCCIQ